MIGFTYLLFMIGTLFVLRPGEGATEILVPPTLNGRLCFCPGDTENYTCNVTGGGVTEWTGTSFDCSSTGDVVSLTNSRFVLGTAIGTCNNGNINAIGTSEDTSFVPSCYTSELSVTIDSNMDGETVQCTKDGPQNVIGSHTLTVAGSPPTHVMVIDIGVSTFTVNWTEPTTDCGSTLSYEINSDCGGSCPVTSSTLGVCSGWDATGQICSVMVRANSNMCGGLMGSFSDAVNLNLTEPLLLENDIDLYPVYQLSDGGLSSLIVSFPPVPAVMVAPSLLLSNAYTITVGNRRRVVPESSCNATLCKYRTEFTSDNRPSNPFTVSVTVSNGIGSGQLLNLRSEVPANIFSLVALTVVVMDSNATVSARLPNTFQALTKLTVTYGIMPDCDTNTIMSDNGMANDTLTVKLTPIQPDTAYCFTIFFNQGVRTFEVMGTFRSECDVANLSTESGVQISEMCPSNGSAGGVLIPNGRVCYTGTIPGAQHIAQPFCNENYQLSSTSSPFRVCQSEGNWNGTVASCQLIHVPFPSWVIPVICAVVLSFAIGIFVGTLLTCFCGTCVQGIRQRNCGTLLLVILLIIVFGLGIGILIGYCCVKNKKEKDDKTHLESQEINPPPADSLYADSKSIEHQAAPGTEDQYAMVDRKGKQNIKPKPTPPEALYQDPNTIEHETAASGDTYAVVDKPKKSSKKKGGPDVVPPPSEGLTYAEIELSSKRPKPGSGRQAPQQPGEYPKEHPVEYSSVDHGNTSQL